MGINARNRSCWDARARMLTLKLEFLYPAKPASEAWASAVSDCRFLIIKEQLRKNFLQKSYTAAKKIGHNGSVYEK